MSHSAALCDDNGDRRGDDVCVCLCSVICGEVTGAPLWRAVSADRRAITVPGPMFSYCTSAASAVQ